MTQLWTSGRERTMESEGAWRRPALAEPRGCAPPLCACVPAHRGPARAAAVRPLALAVPRAAAGRLGRRLAGGSDWRKKGRGGPPAPNSARARATCTVTATVTLSHRHGQSRALCSRGRGPAVRRGPNHAKPNCNGTTVRRLGFNGIKRRLIGQCSRPRAANRPRISESTNAVYCIYTSSMPARRRGVCALREQAMKLDCAQDRPSGPTRLGKQVATG